VSLKFEESGDKEDVKEIAIKVKPDTITSFKSPDNTITIEYYVNLSCKYGKKEHFVTQPVTILNGVPEQ
jgi:hypothetical protein